MLKTSCSNAPYGWSGSPSRGYEVDHFEGAVILEAGVLRRRGLSLRAIAADLARRGIACRSGAPFAAAQVQRMTKVCPPANRKPGANSASSAAARAKRLGAIIVELVDPIRVFDRDGWTCQRCGRATPRHLRGSTALDAPELDHVVPLCRGGPHSYANVRCACRGCNGNKSMRPRADAGWFLSPS